MNENTNNGDIALLDTPTPVPDTNAGTEGEQIRDLREAHARELADIARARQEDRQRWDSDNTQLRNELDQERRKLEEFKVTVRARALQAKERERWCDAGFNAAMDDLGLPRLVRRWVGTATVDVVVTGTDSESLAEAWVRNALTSKDGDVTFEGFEARVDLDEGEDE